MYNYYHCGKWCITSLPSLELSSSQSLVLSNDQDWKKILYHYIKDRSRYELNL